LADGRDLRCGRCACGRCDCASGVGIQPDGKHAGGGCDAALWVYGCGRAEASDVAADGLSAHGAGGHHGQACGCARTACRADCSGWSLQLAGADNGSVHGSRRLTFTIGGTDDENFASG